MAPKLSIEYVSRARLLLSLEDFEPELIKEVQVVIEKSKADDGGAAPEVEAPEVFAGIGDRIRPSP